MSDHIVSYWTQFRWDKNLFYGRSDLQNRSRLFFSKNDPKHMKNFVGFLFFQKIFGKYSDLFSKISSQTFKTLVKKQLILQDLGKIFLTLT